MTYLDDYLYTSSQFGDQVSSYNLHHYSSHNNELASLKELTLLHTSNFDTI